MTTGFKFIPLSSFQGQALADADKYGTSGYNENGEYETRGNAGQGKLTTSCQEFPYVSIMEQLKTRAIVLDRLRMTVQTESQIDNNLVWFGRSSGGKQCSNELNARAYLQPTQFQGKIIDISQRFVFNAYSGLYILVNSGERLNLSCFKKRGTQFNIQVLSTATVPLYAELFAPMDGIVNRRKAEYVNDNTIPGFAPMVKLDGNDLAPINSLLSAIGYEADFISVSVSSALLQYGVNTSRLRLILPKGLGPAFANDYALVNAVLISAIDAGADYNVTIEFTGSANIQFTTLGGA